MFKIFLFALIIFSFTKVFAASFYTGENLDISYLKNDGITSYYRNARAIRNVNTDNIAYCIEPFETLIDHITYKGYSEYDSIFNISKDAYEKVKLISYYGYGYKNHTSSKWISITQMSIWRELEKNKTFEWIDNTLNKNIISPFNTETEELKELVRKHNLKPDIPTEIKMGINEKIEFTDRNGVLEQYSVKRYNVIPGLAGNKLTITSRHEGVFFVTLVRNEKYLEKDVEYFYNKDSQSLIERGNIIPEELIIMVWVSSGSLKLTKVDADSKEITPSGEGILIGAKYELINSKDEVVKTLEIGEDNESYVDGLAYGKYTLREIEASTGYQLDLKEYEITIDEDNKNIELILENKIIEKKIKIIKYYGSKEEQLNGTLKKEVNITFDIYDLNNNLYGSYSTDINGEIEVILPYGSYVIRQVNTTTNYDKVADIELEINEDTLEELVFSLYDLEIEVPPAGISTLNIFSFLRKIFYII